MTHIFISYSSKDESIARQLYSAISGLGIEPFLASISLQPGSQWSKEILSSLKKAQWVLFLASESACQSQAVQQELGAAVISGKEIIPIILDIEPEQLPAWIKELQAIDIRNGNVEELREVLKGIANKIRWDQVTTALLIGAIIGVIAGVMLSRAK
ncbi:toll/interleukin-1 receptor domain-containing protein [Nitrosomonas sp. sh817]|uniref:toll/interleukin-1 receptor domain-containing protein n=1 Tax=Nitrosomonas sp. sh817 TaxID=3070658 RepID=UPI0027DE8DB7|nr:toll/interleukin-1 receptor domain-containing protein [Nitrosomonas sp. sh817]WMJ09633.1 toll/interleukin-1 receptor domain-containing protein [Nitrosomonas sp. sh817]